MSCAPRRGVAAFDFDGTLTRADTLLPFLQRLCGTTAVVRALAIQSGSIRRGFTGGGHRDAFKAKVLARLLAGWPVEEVEEVVSVYAAAVLRGQLRPATLERLDWHRYEGHELIVVSASPEIYVLPIARELRFDAVLATRLEVHDGVLTGRLTGSNVRGAEKVRRLREHLAGDDVDLWAYGDSRGDRELLAAAQMPFMVTARSLVPLRHTSPGGTAPG